MAVPITLSRRSLPLLVTSQGKLLESSSAEGGANQAILPGSFNPLHAGHWELAAAARGMLRRPITFELSVANIEKPELDDADLLQRVQQFKDRADVWLTRAPRFTEKAHLFPGATFVVGADTALRLVQPRFYNDDPFQMLQALEVLRACGSRFLVGGRIDGSGRFCTLDDLPVPATHRDLFAAIPTELFRLDVSSTYLRDCRLQRP